MDLDPTERFSSRVADYVRYRPSYPPGVVTLLETECGLARESRIADIGCGTGLLSRLFLDFGCEVYGVEPNREMRLAGAQFLGDYSRFHCVDGRAEATALPGRSVDFVTAAQAFHWFDAERARTEFRRILRPDGWTVLIWNERSRASAFMEGYEEMVARYGPERPRIVNEALDGFFGVNAWREATLPNQQQFDLDGLRGRFLSSSYAPLPGTPRYWPLMDELAALFRTHEADARVTMLYETNVYFGHLAG